MKRARRSIIATLLVSIYLMISLSPLASLAMYSKSMAHALTNECSGDCNICGCSAESRANRTCCCAKKKQLQKNVVTQAATAHLGAKRSCCNRSQSEKPEVAKKGCCSKTSQHPLDEHDQEPGLEAETTESKTVYKCGNPCNKGKMLSFTGTGTTEILPFIYTERIIPPYEDTRYSHLPQNMTTRQTEPPDPPPKI